MGVTDMAVTSWSFRLNKKSFFFIRVVKVREIPSCTFWVGINSSRFPFKILKSFRHTGQACFWKKTIKRCSTSKCAIRVFIEISIQLCGHIRYFYAGVIDSKKTYIYIYIKTTYYFLRSSHLLLLSTKLNQAS